VDSSCEDSHCADDHDQLPALRATWEPNFDTGHVVIDAQHQGLVTQCNLLADLCAATGAPEGAQAFDQAYAQLEVMAREHFTTEMSVLASSGYPELEDHQFDRDEFDYLVAEIATARNFHRVELQRFLTLWCVGHISGSAQQQREFLAGASAPS
jgi:hemerythrin-like metal-binding protein